MLADYLGHTIAEADYADLRQLREKIKEIRRRKPRTVLSKGPGSIELIQHPPWDRLLRDHFLEAQDADFDKELCSMTAGLNV